MNNPFVSVIIPNYCHSKFLDERIMSVLNQTYQNFELIILDDCSPDNGASRAVIEKYRNNPKVSHIVYNEVNSGSTFKQWNKGFELAKGEVIWIAESDDSCDDTMLAKLVNKLYEDNRNVISFCPSFLIDENGSRLKTNTYKHWHRNFRLDGRTYIKKYMLMSNTIINASAVVFKKAVLSNIPHDYIEYKSAGDHLFWCYLLLEGDVAFVCERLNRFRQHTQKVTNKASMSGLTDHEDIQIYKNISKRIKINLLWKKIIAGNYYDHVRIMKYNEGVRENVINEWKAVIDFSFSSYLIFKICRFLRMLR